jgi:hypothetical protein
MQKGKTQTGVTTNVLTFFTISHDTFTPFRNTFNEFQVNWFYELQNNSLLNVSKFI